MQGCAKLQHLVGTVRSIGCARCQEVPRGACIICLHTTWGNYRAVDLDVAKQPLASFYPIRNQTTF